MSLQSFFSFFTFRKARTHQERWEQLLLRESFRYGFEMYWQLTKVFGIAWVRNCVVFWLFAMVTMQLLSPAPWHWPSAGQFKMLWFVASAAFVFAFPISVVLNNLTPKGGGFRYSRGFAPRGCPRFACHFDHEILSDAALVR